MQESPIVDLPEERAPLISREGWVVLHLFYHLEYATWQLLGADVQREAKTALAQLVQEIRAQENTQLLTFSMVSPKADLGFMLLTPDLHQANAFEKQLSLSLGAEILTPVYSYLSMTEASEYTTTEDQYKEQLKADKGLEPGTPEFDAALDEFNQRMAKYLHHRLYPNLPDWQAFCFYNMSKRRGEQEQVEDLLLGAGHAPIYKAWA